jgi:hypothetical protein
VPVNIFLFSSEASFGHLWVHVLLRIICHLQDEPKATCQPPQGDVTMEAIVKARSGSVLGKGSILKMYFFPGQRRSCSMNFRGTPHVIKVLGCVTNQCEHIFSLDVYTVVLSYWYSCLFLPVKPSMLFKHSDLSK